MVLVLVDGKAMLYFANHKIAGESFEFVLYNLSKSVDLVVTTPRGYKPCTRPRGVSNAKFKI
jgi:hypothetical protein